MPNDLPDFVPSDIPTSSILDLSHTLSINSISSLNTVAGSLTFKPKVFVLPAEYASPDAVQLTRNIVKQWNVDGAGRTLLIVVDLKGHKVRAHGSPELNRAGVTSDYISNALIPQQFVPYMKRGDLTSAIKWTMLNVNQKSQLSQSTSPNATTLASSLLPAENHSSTYVGADFIWPLFFLLAIGVAFAVSLVSPGNRTNRYGNSRNWGKPRPSSSNSYRNSNSSPGFWDNSSSSSSNFTSSSDTGSSSSSDSSSSDSGGSDGGGSW